jgi:hypothetical protein
VKRPKTLEEIRLIAHMEMLSNPTITSYVMVNGKEVRQPALAERVMRVPATMTTTIKPC